MAALRQSLLRGVAAVVAATRRGNAPRAGLRVLMYHAVGSAAEDDRLGLYSIAPALFESHIAALAANDAVAVCTLAAGLQAPQPLRVAITFDDGYRDNLHVAAPLLLRYRMPFTVFVCSGFVGRTSGNFLSAAELRELAALPEIGRAHV